MNAQRIEPHEPNEQLIGLEDLEHDLAVIEEVWMRKRLETLARELAADAKVCELLQSLIKSGVCKDEKEIITRALETFFVAVAPTGERERVLSR